MRCGWGSLAPAADDDTNTLLQKKHKLLVIAKAWQRMLQNAQAQHQPVLHPSALPLGGSQAPQQNTVLDVQPRPDTALPVHLNELYRPSNAHSPQTLGAPVAGVSGFPATAAMVIQPASDALQPGPPPPSPRGAESSNCVLIPTQAIPLPPTQAISIHSTSSAAQQSSTALPATRVQVEAAQHQPMRHSTSAIALPQADATMHQDTNNTMCPQGPHHATIQVLGAAVNSGQGTSAPIREQAAHQTSHNANAQAICRSNITNTIPAVLPPSSTGDDMPGAEDSSSHTKQLGVSQRQTTLTFPTLPPSLHGLSQTHFDAAPPADPTLSSLTTRQCSQPPAGLLQSFHCPPNTVNLHSGTAPNVAPNVATIEIATAAARDVWHSSDPHMQPASAPQPPLHTAPTLHTTSSQSPPKQAAHALPPPTTATTTAPHINLTTAAPCPPGEIAVTTVFFLPPPLPVSQQHSHVSQTQASGGVALASCLFNGLPATEPSEGSPRIGSGSIPDHIPATYPPVTILPPATTPMPAAVPHTHHDTWDIIPDTFASPRVHAEPRTHMGNGQPTSSPAVLPTRLSLEPADLPASPCIPNSPVAPPDGGTQHEGPAHGQPPVVDIQQGRQQGKESARMPVPSRRGLSALLGAAAPAPAARDHRLLSALPYEQQSPVVAAATGQTPCDVSIVEPHHHQHQQVPVQIEIGCSLGLDTRLPQQLQQETEAARTSPGVGPEPQHQHHPQHLQQPRDGVGEWQTRRRGSRSTTPEHVLPLVPCDHGVEGYRWLQMGDTGHGHIHGQHRVGEVRKMQGVGVGEDEGPGSWEARTSTGTGKRGSLGGEGCKGTLSSGRHSGGSGGVGAGHATVGEWGSSGFRNVSEERSEDLGCGVGKGPEGGESERRTVLRQVMGQGGRPGMEPHAPGQPRLDVTSHGMDKTALNITGICGVVLEAQLATPWTSGRQVLGKRLGSTGQESHRKKLPVLSGTPSLSKAPPQTLPQPNPRHAQLVLVPSAASTPICAADRPALIDQLPVAPTALRGASQAPAVQPAAAAALLHPLHGPRLRIRTQPTLAYHPGGLLSAPPTAGTPMHGSRDDIEITTSPDSASPRVRHHPMFLNIPATSPGTSPDEQRPPRAARVHQPHLTTKSLPDPPAQLVPGAHPLSNQRFEDLMQQSAFPANLVEEITAQCDQQPPKSASPRHILDSTGALQGDVGKDCADCAMPLSLTGGLLSEASAVGLGRTPLNISLEGLGGGSSRQPSSALPSPTTFVASPSLAPSSGNLASAPHVHTTTGTGTLGGSFGGFTAAQVGSVEEASATLRRPWLLQHESEVQQDGVAQAPRCRDVPAAPAPGNWADLPVVRDSAATPHAAPDSTVADTPTPSTTGRAASPSPRAPFAPHQPVMPNQAVLKCSETPATCLNNQWPSSEQRPSTNPANTSALPTRTPGVPITSHAADSGLATTGFRPAPTPDSTSGLSNLVVHDTEPPTSPKARAGPVGPNLTPRQLWQAIRDSAPLDHALPYAAIPAVLPRDPDQSTWTESALHKAEAQQATTSDAPQPRMQEVRLQGSAQALIGSTCGNLVAAVVRRALRATNGHDAPCVAATHDVVVLAPPRGMNPAPRLQFPQLDVKVNINSPTSTPTTAPAQTPWQAIAAAAPVPVAMNPQCQGWALGSPLAVVAPPMVCDLAGTEGNSQPQGPGPTDTTNMPVLLVVSPALHTLGCGDASAQKLVRLLSWAPERVVGGAQGRDPYLSDTAPKGRWELTYQLETVYTQVMYSVLAYSDGSSIMAAGEGGHAVVWNLNYYWSTGEGQGEGCPQGEDGAEEVGGMGPGRLEVEVSSTFRLPPAMVNGRGAQDITCLRPLPTQPHMVLGTSCGGDVIIWDTQRLQTTIAMSLPLSQAIPTSSNPFMRHPLPLDITGEVLNRQQQAASLALPQAAPLAPAPAGPGAMLTEHAACMATPGRGLDNGGTGVERGLIMGLPLPLPLAVGGYVQGGATPRQLTVKPPGHVPMSAQMQRECHTGPPGTAPRSVRPGVGGHSRLERSSGGSEVAITNGAAAAAARTPVCFPIHKQPSTEGWSTGSGWTGGWTVTPGSTGQGRGAWREIASGLRKGVAIQWQKGPLSADAPLLLLSVGGAAVPGEGGALEGTEGGGKSTLNVHMEGTEGGGMSTLNVHLVCTDVDVPMSAPEMELPGKVMGMAVCGGRALAVTVGGMMVWDLLQGGCQWMMPYAAVHEGGEVEAHVVCLSPRAGCAAVGGCLLFCTW